MPQPAAQRQQWMAVAAGTSHLLQR